VVAQLIAHGALVPVWVGLELQALDEGLELAIKLPRGTAGALVNRVREKSPASRAGVERGDVVLRLDGHAVDSPRAFFEILAAATPGQGLALDVWRDGRERRLSLRAEAAPAALATALLREKLGVDLRVLPGGGCEVVAVRQGSGAARIGIRRGDLVLGINGRPLDGEEALRRAALDLQGLSGALVVVQRGPGRYHVTIPFA
jgi:serine protease Do